MLQNNGLSEVFISKENFNENKPAGFDCRLPASVPFRVLFLQPGALAGLSRP
jgi:hypothetical protein